MSRSYVAWVPDLGEREANDAVHYYADSAYEAAQKCALRFPTPNRGFEIFVRHVLAHGVAPIIKFGALVRAQVYYEVMQK